MEARVARKRPQGSKRKQLPVHQPRSCDGCSACCHTLRIGALDKPAFAPCQHVSRKGCGIYRQRPAVCAAFRCLWLQGLQIDGVAADQLRPDRLGLLAYTAHSTALGATTLVVAEVWPGAALRRPASTVLAALAAERLVVLETARGRQFLGPRHELRQLNRMLLATGA